MLSPSAHKILTVYGWQLDAGDVYTHAALPGETITLTIGYRRAVVWQHHRPGLAVQTGTGCDSLEYHVMTEARRSGTLSK